MLVHLSINMTIQKLTRGQKSGIIGPSHPHICYCFGYFRPNGIFWEVHRRNLIFSYPLLRGGKLLFLCTPVFDPQKTCFYCFSQCFKEKINIINDQYLLWPKLHWFRWNKYQNNLKFTKLEQTFPVDQGAPLK